MARKPPPSSQFELKVFTSRDEIDRAVRKLEQRIKELEQVNVFDYYGEVQVARNNIQTTILEIYGPNSPEYEQCGDIPWVLPTTLMAPRPKPTGPITILKGLIFELKAKREEFEGDEKVTPSTYFDELNLHPLIADVARDQFLDGYHFEAVFAGSKVLINFVRERAGRYDLDGAPLMRTVFSRNNPLLAFNDLQDQTDLDQQEGLMHLFEGAVLGIRNPGGHSFPEGTEQRAIEYISLLSLLAYLVQEAKKRPSKQEGALSGT